MLFTNWTCSQVGVGGLPNVQASESCQPECEPCESCKREKLKIKTSSNHRFESAGLKALEALLFKMGIERMVMRALF